MKEEKMIRLGPFSRDWGIKSWRIAGDSEPLLHKEINDWITSGFEAGNDVRLITNGVYLERLTPANWIGPRPAVFPLTSCASRSDLNNPTSSGNGLSEPFRVQCHKSENANSQYRLTIGDQSECR